MPSDRKGPLHVAVFGHFGSTNFGNESTLQAFLYHLRRFDPEVRVTCVCTDPRVAAAMYRVEAVPIHATLLGFWAPRGRFLKTVQRICLSIPNELSRWVKACAQLRRVDAFVVPGTGLLTDMDGLLGFGPYSLFRWSLIARLCRCRVLFVSVGAGPLSSGRGRRLVRTALSLASYRSFRDEASRSYLESLGIPVGGDPVFPDLVFSPPEREIHEVPRSGRRVAGLGVMVLPQKLSSRRPRADVYRSYLESLASVVEWLLAQDYDVKFLIGDVNDAKAIGDLRLLVREPTSASAEQRLIAEPATSVDDLVSQIASTDIVIASRYHNVLSAVLCDKPVIAISSHPKCEALMRLVGLSGYCLDIDSFAADQLIERVRQLETDAGELNSLMTEKTAEFREALDRQYELVFAEMGAAHRSDDNAVASPVTAL